MAQLVYSSQSQAAWLENTQLTATQITKNSTMSSDQLKRLSTKDLPYKTSLNNTHYSTSLHIWLVLMLVAIFIIERLLSEWPNSRIKSGMGE